MRPGNTNRPLAKRVKIYAAAGVAVVCSGSALYLSLKSFRDSKYQQSSVDQLRTLVSAPDADLGVKLQYAVKLAEDEQLSAAFDASSSAVTSLPSDAPKEIAASVLGLNAWLTAEISGPRAAEPLLQRASQYSANDLYVLLCSGAILQRRHHLADAAAILEKANHLYPGSAAARDRLGLCMLQAGDADTAGRYLAQAVQLQPKLARYHADYAQALGQISRYKDANIELLQASVLSKGDTSFGPLPAIGHAYSARSQEEYSAAVAELVRLRESQPDSERFCMVLAGLHMRFRRYSDARDQARAVVKINPRSTDGWLKIASASERLGDTNSARSAYAEYQRLTDIRQAVVDGKNGALFHPKDIENLVRLSDALLQSGRPEQALEPLQSAASQRPNDSKLQAKLANLESRLGAANPADRGVQ